MHRYRKSFILIVLSVSVVLGVIIFVGFRSSQAFNKNLELSIANSIIRDQLNLSKKSSRSPEGSVVVRIQPESGDPALYSWNDAHSISIWKYEKGILKLASPIDLEQIKRDRNAYLFIFMIQKIDGTKTFVDLATIYPKSNTEGFSGGGNAAHWLFEYIDQNWHLMKKDPYLVWD